MVVAVTRVVAAPKPPRSDADTAHQPEGWRATDGLYPQIAGQFWPVIIKQMADIRAGNRDTLTMFPFTMLNVLGL